MSQKPTTSSLLNQLELRSIVNYDANMGRLIWIKPGKKRIMGAPIGSVRPDGYLETCINRQRYFVHRLVWLWHHGEFPQDHTDHINHQRGDNRIENLRAVTNQQNNFNQSKRSNPTSSAYRGVDWVPRRGNWRARFNIGHTSRHLGYYPDEGTAAMVWNEVASMAYGEHANLNTAE